MSETCFVCLEDDSSERLITGMCACRMSVHPSCMRDTIMKMHRTMCTVCKQEYRRIVVRYEYGRMQVGIAVLMTTASATLLFSLYLLTRRVARCKAPLQCVVECVVMFVMVQMLAIVVFVSSRMRWTRERVMCDVVIECDSPPRRRWCRSDCLGVCRGRDDGDLLRLPR